MSKHDKNIYSNCQGHKIIMTKNPLNVHENYEKIQVSRFFKFWIKVWGDQNLLKLRKFCEKFRG